MSTRTVVLGGQSLNGVTITTTSGTTQCVVLRESQIVAGAMRREGTIIRTSDGSFRVVNVIDQDRPLDLRLLLINLTGGNGALREASRVVQRAALTGGLTFTDIGADAMTVSTPGPLNVEEVADPVRARQGQLELRITGTAAPYLLGASATATTINQTTGAPSLQTLTLNGDLPPDVKWTLTNTSGSGIKGVAFGLTQRGASFTVGQTASTTLAAGASGSTTVVWPEAVMVYVRVANGSGAPIIAVTESTGGASVSTAVTHSYQHWRRLGVLRAYQITQTGGRSTSAVTIRNSGTGSLTVTAIVGIPVEHGAWLIDDVNSGSDPKVWDSSGSWTGTALTPTVADYPNDVGFAPNPLSPYQPLMVGAMHGVLLTSSQPMWNDSAGSADTLTSTAGQIVGTYRPRYLLPGH